MARGEGEIHKWTTDDIANLRAWWAQGLRASAIQRRMPKRTRNSIIGKIDRLNLRGRVSGGGGNRVIKPPRMVPQVKNRPVAQEAIEPSAEVDTSVAPIFAGVGILLAVVRDGLCRWPYDGGTAGEARCCGDATIDASSYCAKHADISRRGVKKWERSPINPSRFI